jgi:hypothetical protein
MAFRNDLGLASAATNYEARTIVGSGKRDKRSSKSSPNEAQAAIHTELHRWDAATVLSLTVRGTAHMLPCSPSVDCGRVGSGDAGRGRAQRGASARSHVCGRATMVDILARLKGVRRSGEGWTAKCPAHKDKQNSLSVHHRDARSRAFNSVPAFPRASCRDSFSRSLPTTASTTAPR